MCFINEEQNEYKLLTKQARELILQDKKKYTKKESDN